MSITLRDSAENKQATCSSTEDRRINNLDLIRLAASGQVAVVHTGESLDVLSANVIMWLGLFPGVPIFFFVSGFLISQSLERAISRETYIRNRILRIFPALWACLLLSVALVAAFQPLPWASLDFAAWFIGQSTFVQFYNPEFLRDFGLGTLNGSPWTIPVELQFYIVLPFTFLFVRHLGEWVFWAILFIALIAHGIFLGTFYGDETLISKLLQVSFAPWFGLFMVGAAANRIWPRIERFFRGYAPIWTFIYIVIAVPTVATFGDDVTGNRLPGPLCIALCCLILSLGYTKTHLARTMLKGTDISYGLYLFHAPLINAYLELSQRGLIELPGSVGALLVILLATVLAIASWNLIERPALSLRKTPINAPGIGPRTRQEINL